MDRTHIPISPTASPNEIAEIEVENRRRKPADRIQIALELNIRDTELLLNHPTSHKAKELAEKGQPPKVRHDYQPLPGDNFRYYSRYTEIEDYLFRNRLALALDTPNSNAIENNV